MFMFAICRRPSVCLSSVTFVHPTQAIEIFGNVSIETLPKISGTLAIYDPSVKILRRSSQGNPSVGGFGEMPSKLWLIVANFQIHWATLPPKGSVFIAQSGRLRYISSDKKQLYALLIIKEKKHILNQTHHINRRLTNKLTKRGTIILL